MGDTPDISHDRRVWWRSIPIPGSRRLDQRTLQRLCIQSVLVAAVANDLRRTKEDPHQIPYCCKKPTLDPLNFRAHMKTDIEAGVMKGILESVPAGEHDTWCSRLVVQEKKNGKARRTVDLSYLSKHGLDESHYTRSAPMIAKSIPGILYKSTIDCVDGYHGIPLAEEDRHKTTECGKFRYKRASQGYLSSGDSILSDCNKNGLVFNPTKFRFARN